MDALGKLGEHSRSNNDITLLSLIEIVSTKQLFFICLVVYCFKSLVIMSLLYDGQLSDPLLAATGRSSRS